MGWNFDDGGNDKQSFTKFPVGVTRIRVLDVEPDVRWTHWMPQYGKSLNCPGRGCPIDEIRRKQKANGEPYTYNMARRLAMNIYNHETGRLEIMEQGITFFEDLRDIMEDLRENGKTLRDVIIKVRRRGTGKDDTSYRIDVDAPIPMSKEETEALETRVDLREYFKPHTPEQILQLLEVRAETPDKYKEAWNNIMSEAKPSDEPSEPEDGEEIEVR